MCVVLEPPPLRDTPARGRPARARHPPLVAFPLCYAPAMMAVFAARKSIGLSPSASRRATLTRPPAFRPDPSSTPGCPRSCGGSPRCARARTSSRASATSPRVARRRRRESSPTSSRATRGKPCARPASEDAMSCRCVFDFAAISRKDTRRTLRRRRPRRLAPELPLSRAPPRAPRRRWTRCFLASSRKNTRFGRFPFFASASSLAFRVVRAMRKGFVSARRYPRNAARSSRRGARPRGGASLGTPPHRPARPRAVPGPGCDARAARPTAPTPLSRWPSRRLVHDRGKELVFPREISTSAQQNARNETKRDFSLCFLRCFRIRARRETAQGRL